MGRIYFLPAWLCEVIHTSGRFRAPPRVYVASVSVSTASSTQRWLLARISKPRSEAYLRSVTGRFERAGEPLNSIQNEAIDGDRALGGTALRFHLILGHLLP